MVKVKGGSPGNEELILLSWIFLFYATQIADKGLKTGSCTPEIEQPQGIFSNIAGFLDRLLLFFFHWNLEKGRHDITAVTPYKKGDSIQIIIE